MEKRGGLKKATDGGRTIFEPLFHGTNSSVKFYDGYETFTPDTASEVLDGSEWAWKQMGGFITISGREMVMNSGKGRALDLLDGKQKHLKAQMKNTFAASLYSDGTGTAGKEFGGLQLLVADSPSSAGTVGSIDQAANSFWRNQVSTSAVFNSTNALARMNQLYLNCIRGSEVPDLIVTDAEMFGQYEASQQQYQRFSDADLAQAGFISYKYKTADVVYDENCPTRRLYMLNTDNLAFRYASDRWFSVGDPRQVTNADYEVIPLWVMGNLTTNDRARHGVLISSGTA